MSELAKKLIAENKRTKAKSLDLGNCGLRDLEKEVPELFECVWLEELILTNYWESQGDNELYNIKESCNNGEINELSKIPPQIVRLDKLKTLSMGGGFLVSIWEISDTHFLEKLLKLETLYLCFNQINDIQFLDKLIGLQTLYLENNQISGIQFIDMSSSLQTLDLSDNQISKISFSEKLTGLQSLDLSNNQISDIRFLGNLTGLQSLSLGSNKITDIRFLEKLTGLQSLSLSSNKITDIRFLENLTGLQSLSLSNNQISDIRFLSNLSLKSLSKRLDISNNKITDLSPILPLIKRGLPVKWDRWDNGICVQDNPFSTPPTEIIKEGNEAILRYFEELERSGLDYLYEAKVLLVGEGNVGKTTLRTKLEDAEADMPPAYARTPGIEIHRIPFQHLDERNFFLNVWDFGGQDIYHNTHHFFLTKRSLYVLVTNTRSQEDNFDYWIPNIRLFGGKSPILIVKNKWQDAVKGSSIDRKISITRFRQNEAFNIPENLLEVNLYTKENLDKLSQTILHHATQLPLVGSEVPKSWVEVRNALKERSAIEAYISFSDFESTCREVGIEEAEKISDLARFFHDLGIVLWYEDIPALKNRVILQPEWATDAVYLIINNEQIQNQKGHFSYQDLERIWTDVRHRDMCHELLEMMKEFRLCYQKRSRKKAFIIPSLLSPEPPKIKWDNSHNIQLQYEYSFMPKGIVNQLSAELHAYIQSDRHIWGQGVVLTDKNGLFKAKIEEDWFNRKIDIRTSGVDARAILRRITDTIENDIHQYFPGVDFKKLVPCFCDTCEKSQTPKFYEYKELLEVLKIDKNYYCNTGRQFFNIRRALFNIGEEKYGGVRNSSFDKKLEEKTTHHNSPKKLFIAYSDEDEAYLEGLKKQLAILDRKGQLVTWDDTCIFAGEDWGERTEAALKEADMILLLVSADFLANDQIDAIEVATALRLKEIGKTAIVPIVIRPCMWKRSDFAKYSVLPPKGKPISKWADRDEAWLSVVEGIAELL